MALLAAFLGVSRGWPVRWCRLVPYVPSREADGVYKCRARALLWSAARAAAGKVYEGMYDIGVGGRRAYEPVR